MQVSSRNTNLMMDLPSPEQTFSRTAHTFVTCNLTVLFCNKIRLVWTEYSVKRNYLERKVAPSHRTLFVCSRTSLRGIMCLIDETSIAFYKAYFFILTRHWFAKTFLRILNNPFFNKRFIPVITQSLHILTILRSERNAHRL